MGKLNPQNLKTSKKKLCGECDDCHEKFEMDKLTQINYRWICPACKTGRETAEIQAQFEKWIPKKYQGIDTDRHEKMKKAEGKSLFLYGDVGSGKTVFACSMLKKYITERQKIKFISYPAWIMKLQNAYRDKEISPFQMAQDIANFTGWLCIDDLGAEKLTPYVQQITYYVINEREQRMLPIIITSNYTLDEINDLIDKRITSRIAGMCKLLNFGKKDKRLEK